MMPTLRELIANRRAEVEAQIKLLRAELAEIAVVERALPSGGAELPPRRAAAARSSTKRTLKQMAMAVLAEHPDGLDANQLISEVQARFQLVVPRPSMSPQLSRLGRDGILRRDGMTWKLTNQGRADLAEPQQDETPDAATSGASEAERDREEAESPPVSTPNPVPAGR